MRKLQLIIFLLIFIISFAKAQSTDSLFVKKYVMRINVFSPGIGGEYNINKGRSIRFDVGVKFLNYSDLYKSTYFSIDYRDYINTKERNLKDKRIDKFSGPYGGLRIEYIRSLERVSKSYIYDEDHNPFYFEFGPIIGFQRAIGKIWYWDFNAGVGPCFTHDDFLFNFFSSLKFGVTF